MKLQKLYRQLEKVMMDALVEEYYSKYQILLEDAIRKN